GPHLRGHPDAAGGGARGPPRGSAGGLLLRDPHPHRRVPVRREVGHQPGEDDVQARATDRAGAWDSVSAPRALLPPDRSRLRPTPGGAQAAHPLRAARDLVRERARAAEPLPPEPLPRPEADAILITR